MDRKLTKEEIRKAKLKKIYTYTGIGAGILLVAGVTMYMSRSGVKGDELVFSTVDTGSIQVSVNAAGNVVPGFEEIINSPISTRIVEVYRSAGDSVDVGTPLLRLDLQSTETEVNNLKDQIQIKQYELHRQNADNLTHVKDLEMQVKVKEMAVDRIAVELANEQYLDSLGSGTGDRVREAELKYLTGKLELEQLRQKLVSERNAADAGVKMKNLEINIAEKNLGEMSRTLDDARIRAPRRATLTFINDQIGQKVAEGEKIAVISDLSHFKVEGEIADCYGDRIGVGSKAVVKSGRQQLTGIVANVTPLSRNGVISFTVRLDDDSNLMLRSGLKTDIYIMCGQMDDVMRIKNGIFYTGPGSYDLFVKSSADRLERRNVRLGDSNYDYVEVISGLRQGEEVVVNDMKRFKDKSSLSIK